jgi:DNA-binding transcriptional LysR family regulator
LDEAMMVIRELRGMERGRLQVAADTTAGVYVVPPLLGAFKARYPQVTISMSVVNRATVQEKLLSHEVDLAVMGHTLPGDELTVTPLRRNQLVVIAPPGHHLSGQRAIGVEQLRDEGFIGREPGSGTRASMERFFDQHGLKPNVVMELSDNGAIKQAVAAGIGLAVISESAIELELAAERVCVLDIEGFPLVRHWYSVYLARKRLSPPARAFLTLLNTEARDKEDEA